MLINCKECGYKYSSEAEKCPKCGMPNKDLMEIRRKAQQQQQKKNQIRQEINNRYNYWKNIHENQVLLMIGFFGMLIGFAVGYGISYFFITKNVTDCINGGILFAFFGSMPIPFALKPPLFGAFAVYAIVADFLKWNTAKIVTDKVLLVGTIFFGLVIPAYGFYTSGKAWNQMKLIEEELRNQE